MSDQDLITHTVNNYLKGAQDGDSALLRQAFYTSCNLHSIDGEGRLEIVALERFLVFSDKKLLPEHTSRILDIECINDMARATVEFEFDSFYFKDYLTLLKIDETWRIVSKIYTKIPK